MPFSIAWTRGDAAQLESVKYVQLIEKQGAPLRGDRPSRESVDFARWVGSTAGSRASPAAGAARRAAVWHCHNHPAARSAGDRP